MLLYLSKDSKYNNNAINIIQKLEKFILEKINNNKGWINNGHYIFNKELFINSPTKFSLETAPQL